MLSYTVRDSILHDRGLANRTTPDRGIMPSHPCTPVGKNLLSSTKSEQFSRRNKNAAAYVAFSLRIEFSVLSYIHFYRERGVCVPIVLLVADHLTSSEARHRI